MNEVGQLDRPRRTTAGVRRSWWPGWIWAIPLAALGVCVWLLVRVLSTHGTGIEISFDDAVGMKPKDTKVMYRGLEIGQVTSVRLDSKSPSVVAEVDINDSAKRYLVSGTKFYLEGKPSLSDPFSLKTIISGPSIEMVPATGAAARHFKGVDGKPPPSLAVAIPYRVVFDGDVGNLEPGSAVSLRGFTVGRVDSVRLTIDPQTGALSTPVELALDPTRLDLAHNASGDGDWTKSLNAALTKLVAQGLRARLTQDPPLLGAWHVSLDFVHDAKPAQLTTVGTQTEIPADDNSGIGGVIDQIGAVPIAQIGDNVRAITEHVNALVSEPQLKDTIEHLDRSVAQLDKTLAAAGPQVGPMVLSLRRTIDKLRETASQIDTTATAMKSMMGGSPTSPNGNLQQALNELTQAGRAVRGLANDLDQHPESLIRGR